jgi:hypothetical protein
MRTSKGSAMSKADEFRARAKQADERAMQASNVEARQTLVEVARLWHEMAEQAERHGW